MLLIGLAASNVERRIAVANAMMESGLCQVSAWANQSVDPPQQRVARIDALVSVTPRRWTDCLVFAHVMSEAEAERLRSLGASIWHVQGEPSDDVRIVRGDLLVTPTSGGDRHYLDPVEALSEELIREGEHASA